MFNVQTLNKISKIGLSRLGDNYNIADDVQNPDAVLVRSAAMHDMELPESLLAIARAGAGVNNIPLDKFRLTSAVKRVSLYSTLPVQMQTLLRSLFLQDFSSAQEKLLTVSHGQRLLKVTVTLSARWLKRARASL